MKRGFFGLLSLGLIASALAQPPLTNFASVADQVRAQPLNLPSDSPLIVLGFKDKKLTRQALTFRRSFAADGSFTTSLQTDRFSSVARFQKNGTLISTRQIDLQKKIQLDVQVNAQRTKAQFIILEEGKEKSNKTPDLSKDIALQGEMQYLIMQAWQAGIRDGLALKSLSPDGGLPGDFEIRFSETSNPLASSSKYDYPAEFKTAFPGNARYLVGDMALAGVAAFFYPHHFYLVFRQTPAGLDFCGYFGEDPANPTFQYKPTVE